jgi:hypothetical protein
MSPTRSGYRELGLELVSLKDNCSFQSKWPPMEEEKRDEGAEDPINMLLTKSLMQQRNVMLDNFTQILQRLLTIIGVSLSSITLDMLPHSTYNLILIFSYLKVRLMEML